MEKGYVHLYTGDGKGKTTAAFGLVLRAAGHGLTSYVGQFMKGQRYGEVEALAENPLVTVEQYGDPVCFRREEVTAAHVAMAEKGLERAAGAMRSGRYDLVVLDELNVALWFGLLKTDAVLALLADKPESLEMVLTGRRAPEELVAAADLVTEMREMRHYYTQGVLARDGIER